MNILVIHSIELLMFFNGDNIIFILVSFLPLPNKYIVFMYFIINTKSFMPSKRIFKELTTFEDYYNPIARAKVWHQFYYNSLNLMFFKRRELSKTY